MIKKQPRDGEKWEHIPRRSEFISVVVIIDLKERTTTLINWCYWLSDSVLSSHPAAFHVGLNHFRRGVKCIAALAEVCSGKRDSSCNDRTYSIESNSVSISFRTIFYGMLVMKFLSVL